MTTGDRLAEEYRCVDCGGPRSYGSAARCRRCYLHRAQLAERAAAWRLGYHAALEDAVRHAATWTKPSELRLRCGEMTAQEMRTAKAVANGITRMIRLLTK